MQTMSEFLAAHPVTLEILDGPNYEREQDEREWEHHAYRLELRHEARTMIVPWRQGLGITDDPDAGTVLDSLASDSVGVEQTGSFEDWAPEYGFDVDSRKAETTYEQCRAQAQQLRDLLGEATDALLYETERL